MSVEVRVPTVLRRHTGGERVVRAEGGTVSAVLDSLVHEYPGLKDELLNEEGQIRQFGSSGLAHEAQCPESAAVPHHGQQTMPAVTPAPQPAQRESTGPPSAAVTRRTSS